MRKYWKFLLVLTFVVVTMLMLTVSVAADEKYCSTCDDVTERCEDCYRCLVHNDNCCEDCGLCYEHHEDLWCKMCEDECIVNSPGCIEENCLLCADCYFKCDMCDKCIVCEDENGCAEHGVCRECMESNDAYCTACDQGLCCFHEWGCEYCYICIGCVDQWCDDCKRCPECTIFCSYDNCSNCYECGIDFCPGCDICEDHADLMCELCGYCGECVDICEICEVVCGDCMGLCPDCNAVCGECTTLCPDCGVCGDCANICPDCGLCENCTTLCEGCYTCEDHVDIICEDCGDHCSNCFQEFCGDCGLCSDCVDFCEECREYCVECAYVCPECGVCENCVDLCFDCENCESHCTCDDGPSYDGSGSGGDDDGYDDGGDGDGEDDDDHNHDSDTVNKKKCPGCGIKKLLCWSCGRCEKCCTCTRFWQKCTECGDYSDVLCRKSDTCLDCVKVCGYCDERGACCYDFCKNCGYCEKCCKCSNRQLITIGDCCGDDNVEVCSICREACDTCSWICRGCGTCLECADGKMCTTDYYCENCATLCTNIASGDCDAGCSNHSTLCRRCGKCDSCVTFCDSCSYCIECCICDGDLNEDWYSHDCNDFTKCSVCGNYCTACSFLCPECNVCENCAMICGNCLKCEACAGSCPECNYCLDCCECGGVVLEHDHYASAGEQRYNSTHHWAICGIKGCTFEFEGSREEHTFADGALQCTSCLYTKTAAGHTHSITKVRGLAASCAKAGYKEYYSCSGCNKLFSDAKAKNEIFNIDEWKNGDGKIDALGHNHTKKVHDDAHLVPGSGSNCQSYKRYYFECSRCGALGTTSWVSSTLGEHVYDTTKWGYKDGTGHARKCKYCDELKPIESHIPGAEATETTAQICSGCGYVLSPATGHTHNFTKVDEVAATCTTDGNIRYYVCGDCGEWYENLLGTVIIQNHDDVVIKAETATHVDLDLNGECDVCKKKNPAEKPSETDSPVEDPTDNPTDNQKDNNEKSEISLWLLIVITVVAVAIGVGLALIIAGKKNKKS